MIIIILLLLCGICEFADAVVYGSFLYNNRLADVKSEIASERADVTHGIIHLYNGIFIAKKWGITSRWYIHGRDGNRRVWRFSKIEKELDARYKELQTKSKSTF